MLATASARGKQQCMADDVGTIICGQVLVLLAIMLAFLLR